MSQDLLLRLGVSGAAAVTTGVKGADDAVKGYDDRVRKAADGSEAFSARLSGVVKAAAGLVVFREVSGYVRAVAGELLQAQIRAESLQTTLSFAAVRPAATEIKYLRETTNALGLEFTSTAKSYASFMAAARETKLEGEASRKVFESVAKASTVMGLSAAENEGVLRALSQMISKGTVQAEELRGQLGERLPGAFQIAARSMGVTTAQLGKMLEQGQVLADDFLPRFAEQLDKELGGAAEKAADRTEAAVNRMANAWERLKGATAAASGDASTVGGLGYVMGNMADAMEQARAEGSGFTMQMLAAGGAVLKFFNPLASVADQTKKFGLAIKGAEADLAILQTQLEKNPESFRFRNAIAETQALIDKLREADLLSRQLDQTGAETARLNRGAPGAGDETGAESGRLARRARQATEQGAVFAKYATDAQKLRAELDQVRVAFDGVIPPELEKQIRGKFVHPAAAGVDAFAKLRGEVQKNIDALQNEADTGQKTSKAAALRTELARGLSAEYNKLTLAQKRVIMGGIDEWEAQEQANQATKDAIKLARERADARNKETAGIDAYLAKQAEDQRAQLKSVEDRIQALKDEDLAAAIAAGRNISLAEAVEEVSLARLREKQARLNEGTPAWEAIEREIQARRELIGLVNANAARQATRDATSAAADAWDRVNEDAGRGLAEALMQGGKSAWEYIKGMVRAQALRPVIEVLSRPITNALNGLMGGPGGASSGGPGGGGSGLSIGSASKWFSDFGGQAAFSAETAGNWLVNNTSGMANRAGSWMMESSGTIGDVAGIAGDAIGYLRAFKNLKDGNYAAAAGSAIGTYIGGPLGAMVGEKVGAAVDKIFKGNAGSPHLGGYAAINSDGSLNKAFGQGESNRSSELDKEVLGLVGTVNGLLNNTAKAFGGEANFATTGTFKSDSKDPSWAVLQLLRGGTQVGGFRAEGTLLADPGKGFEQFTVQAAASVRQALLDMDLPAWADEVLGTLADSASIDDVAKVADGISQTAGAITTLQGQLVPLGGVFQRIGELSSDATFKLGQAAGSLGNLNTQLESYYANFYTDAERTAMGLQRVGAELRTVGLEVPKTREQFRALVDSFGQTGGVSQEQLSALLRVNSAFAELVPLSEAAATSLEDYTTRLARAIDTAAPKFLSPAQLEARSYQQISNSLQKVGIVAGTDALRQFTKTQIFEFASAYVASADNAVDAKLAIVEAASALADLKDSASGLTSSLLEDIRQFNASIGFSDLSPLNPTEQLAQARALFDDTVARAQGGDAAASGQLVTNGRALIEEARSYYGSAAGSAVIFDLVRNQLGQFLPENQSLVGPFNPGATEAAQQLQSVVTIQNGLQAMETSAAQGRDVQAQLLREQLARAQVMIENQAAQIQQQAAIAAQTLARLEAIDARAARLVAAAEEAALREG